MNKIHDEKDINYPEQLNMLFDKGRYWEATELLREINYSINKKEQADKDNILYDIDIEKFLEGMCCCESTDSCFAGIGGCSGCGGCLFSSILVCYCCSGQDLGAGCDTVSGAWNSCCCIDILCGKSCECG